MKKRFYLSSVLEEYNMHITIVEKLIKLNRIETLSEEFLLRDLENKTRSRKALMVLLDELKLEKNNLVEKLKDIAFTFNETETYVYLELLTNGAKTAEEIAKELDLTEKYTRALINRIQKEINKYLEQNKQNKGVVKKLEALVEEQKINDSSQV